MQSLDSNIDGLRKYECAIFWLEAVRDLVVIALFLCTLAVWVA